MPAQTSKNRLVLVSSVIISITVIATFVLYTQSSNKTSTSSKKSSDSSSKSSEETLSPGDLVQNYKNYDGKEVTVVGVIVKHGTDYSILDSLDSQAKSLKLDVSKSGTSPDNLFNKDTQISKTVVVKGTFKTSPSAVVIASSIKSK